VEKLGAKPLNDMTTTLFQIEGNGSKVSTKGLEPLVYLLSGFDTSDRYDTINALRHISREFTRSDWVEGLQVPVSDYKEGIFEVYPDFVK
jgi:hypothetical protein